MDRVVDERTQKAVSEMLVQAFSVATPDQNPLILPLIDQLSFWCQGMSEFDLIRSLQQLPGLKNLSLSANVKCLFDTHFMLFNALYVIDTCLREKSLHYLEIGALNIQLFQRQPADIGLQLTADTAHVSLRDYYLDISQLRDTSAEDVDFMLAGFWRQFFSQDQLAESYAALDLNADAQWFEVKQRYKQLAAIHHPDKGGNNESFTRIANAYECIKQTMG